MKITGTRDRGRLNLTVDARAEAAGKADNTCLPEAAGNARGTNSFARGTG
ncbi:MAG: hypothetical protein LBQ38_01415 [Spirochaetaceae bacterium]|nr:hypothetical protein [Spirochaetaceae bacterium]